MTSPSPSQSPAPTANAQSSLTELFQTYMSGVVRDGSKRGKRRRAVSEDSDVDENGEIPVGKDFLDHGRCFARLGDPFTKIYNIVHHGLGVEGRDSGDEGEGMGESDESRHMTASWNILCNMIPGFRSEMVSAAASRKIRRNFSLHINKGVDNARADDSGSLKGPILGYLHLNIQVPLQPPIPQGSPHKSLRGWNHPVTAALLTPMEWEANDLTSAEVKSGRRKVTADQFPRFLYPEGHVYNPEDIEDDLFRSHVMIRCAKHLYTGPASALQAAGFKKGRANISKIIGMTAFTPRALAYLALQVRFSISDVQEWQPVDRDFNYQSFFWNVVDILDTSEGKTILAFFNQEVFGKAAQGDPLGCRSRESVHVAGKSAVEELKAQRAAKRARVELSADAIVS